MMTYQTNETMVFGKNAKGGFSVPKHFFNVINEKSSKEKDLDYSDMHIAFMEESLKDGSLSAFPPSLSMEACVDMWVDAICKNIALQANLF